MSAETGVGFGERLAAIEARIGAACDRAQRPRQAVTLLAVSKRHPAAAVREALALDVVCFGENYVQELCEKADEVGAGPRWYFIGGLQRNKVRPLVERGITIASVDSLRLAQRIDRIAQDLGKSMTVWLQVNLSHEAQKSGVGLDDVGRLHEACAGLSALQVEGLMGVTAIDAAPSLRAVQYVQLAERADALGLSGVSAGTSDDFEVAIEAGATMVRLGTTLFGPRPN